MTFLCLWDKSDPINNAGYTFYRKHSSQSYTRNSGGIGIFVCNNLARIVHLLNSSDPIVYILGHEFFIGLQNPPTREHDISHVFTMRRQIQVKSS